VVGEIAPAHATLPNGRVSEFFLRKRPDAYSRKNGHALKMKATIFEGGRVAIGGAFGVHYYLPQIPTINVGIYRKRSCILYFHALT
jgi:hypothetical protein